MTLKDEIYCLIARNESVWSIIKASIDYGHAVNDGLMVRWSCEMAISRAARAYRREISNG